METGYAREMSDKGHCLGVRNIGEVLDLLKQAWMVTHTGRSYWWGLRYTQSRRRIINKLRISIVSPSHLCVLLYPSVISRRPWPLSWQIMFLLLSIDQINAHYLQVFFIVNKKITISFSLLQGVSISSVNGGSLFEDKRQLIIWTWVMPCCQLLHQKIVPGLLNCLV